MYSAINKIELLPSTNYLAHIEGSCANPELFFALYVYCIIRLVKLQMCHSFC